MQGKAGRLNINFSEISTAHMWPSACLLPCDHSEKPPETFALKPGTSVQFPLPALTLSKEA